MPRKVDFCKSAQSTNRIVNQFKTALLRGCAHADVPEGRLMASVIVQAFADTQGHAVDSPGARADAGRFFVDGRMVRFAELAGAEPDYVRRIYADGMKYLAANAAA